MEEEPLFEVTPPGGRPPLPSPTAEEPVVAEPAESRDDQEEAGRQLAQQMQELGYHPVVIFGSTSSGKTTLLCSLLSYIRRDAGAGAEVSLGEEFALSSEYGRWAHEKAAAFFFRAVHEHINERTQAATRTQFPFFIPVVLQPGKGRPAVKIALLESNGEWYNPDTGSDRYFQKMRAEIAGLLRSFGGGVSFLHLAPVTQLEQYRESQDGDREKNEKLRGAADLALVGCINSYRDLRALKHNDRHLLLVTKWDDHVAPQDPSNRFSEPSLIEVKEVARTKYPLAYAAFANLDTGGDNHAKQILQYCSGLISGRQILGRDAEVEAQLRRYPRTLWNWIYRSALSQRGGSPSPLYDEPRPPAPNLRQRLAALLERIFGV